MPEDTKPNLRTKVARIAAACAYVQKDGHNGHFNYKFASAANVLARVNEAMADQNVCSTADVEIVERDGKNVTVKLTITIHDGDSDETLTTSGMGTGQDTGDKAVMKAETAAIKYAWMMALNISTGDDPEADQSTDRRSTRAPASRPSAPAAAPKVFTVEDWESFRKRAEAAKFAVKPLPEGADSDAIGKHIASETARYRASQNKAA